MNGELAQTGLFSAPGVRSVLARDARTRNVHFTLCPNCKARAGSITTLDTEHAVVTMSSPETLAQSALAGTGIARMGVHHTWKHLRSGELRAVLLDSHGPGTYEMRIQYPHRALVAPRVRVTVEYLLNVFAKLQDLHVPPASLRNY